MNRGWMARRLLAVVLALSTLVTLGLYYNGLSSGGVRPEDRAAPPAVDSPAPRVQPVVHAEWPPLSDDGSELSSNDLSVPWSNTRPIAAPRQQLSAQVDHDTCPELGLANTTIETVSEFSKFEFQPVWMKSREYWNNSFDERYKKLQEDVASKKRLPMKIVVVPHSHNDPGWLKTFEGYYHLQTSKILNYMVEKMVLYKNMTFIWSEISFFAMWWESAHPTKRKVVQRLLAEGRLEITTGGWVMTDEATAHIYSMLDQLIEGHQWVKNNLGVNVKTGWSVDPFGHGPTVPYLLRKSEVTGGAIIQRIHYAWKQWFAQNMNGDFFWRQNWDWAGHTDTLVHNMPFDIYSIRGSCGPHPQVCINFDFRKVPGEYTDYSQQAVFIDEQNKMQKADLLMEQYGRTASVSPHNVALVPIGDDFRYDHDTEWDQQYTNYQKLFDFIKANPDRYHGAEVGFGTPSDFFKALRERSEGKFPSLRGDFFVYSDVFTDGRPAYWNGYYTTRPYWKVLDRELEAKLRTTEILYTFALNDARRRKGRTVKLLERNYEKLVRARQNLALFQHHDAITGTSKAAVMVDYALKLFEGMQNCAEVQSFAAQCLLMSEGDEGGGASSAGEREADAIGAMVAHVLTPDSDRQTYDQPASKLALHVSESLPRNVVVFNSLARRKSEPVRVLVSDPDVRVTDASGAVLRHQVNPVWNASEGTAEQPLAMSKSCYELLFVAVLEPLSLTTFTVHKAPADPESVAVVYCKNCAAHSPAFNARPMRLGDVQLENEHLRALFDGKTGLLRSVTDKATGVAQHVAVDFAAYQSAQLKSGAYLFMPDPNLRDTEKRVLDDYPGPATVVVTSGPLSSEITVVYSIITHTVRLYHGRALETRGLYVENVVDFKQPPKNRETEMFMRLSSGINNGEPAEMYTDSNGFQMQRRVTVKRVGIQGNYYPVTTAAYIEDARQRLTVLVNHAQGAAAWEPGRVELMLDRRTLYDDSRGMGEGVVDNKKTLTKYWILLESREETRKDQATTSNPSLVANQLSEALLYPATVFVVEPEAKHLLRSSTALLSAPVPCDVHLMNLRTNTDPVFQQFPAESALLVLHRKGYDCHVATGFRVPECELRRDRAVFERGTRLAKFDELTVAKTSLSGLHQAETIDRLDQLEVAPMELCAFNVTFGTDN